MNENRSKRLTHVTGGEGSVHGAACCWYQYRCLFLVIVWADSGPVPNQGSPL